MADAVSAVSDVAKLYHAVENSPIAVMITDDCGIIEYVNQHFTDLTGYLAEEAVGRTPRIVNSGLEDSAVFQELWQTITRGETWRGEIRNRAKTGEVYWGSNVIVPLRSDDGRILRYVGFSEDVSEAVENRRRRTELIQSLQEANEKLIEADRQKTEFLAVASHELRTPLTIIRQFLDLLDRGVAGPLNDGQMELLDPALAGCVRLGDLVNELLDLQKIEMGKAQPQRCYCDLAPLCEKIVADFQQRCAAKNVTCRHETEAERLPVLADEGMLTQVLINLVGNAVKFTPEGGRVIVAAKEIDGVVTVSVTDTGPGIPAEEQAGIFEVFRQAGGSQGASDKGSGLGLAISQRLIDLHGSEITLESRPGDGASFSFALPLFSEAEQIKGLVADALHAAADGHASLTLMRLEWSSPGPLTADERGHLAAGILSQLLRGREDVVAQIEQSDRVAAVLVARSAIARAKVKQLAGYLADHAFPTDELRFCIVPINADAELPVEDFTPVCEYEECSLAKKKM